MAYPASGRRPQAILAIWLALLMILHAAHVHAQRSLKQDVKPPKKASQAASSGVGAAKDADVKLPKGQGQSKRFIRGADALARLKSDKVKAKAMANAYGISVDRLQKDISVDSDLALDTKTSKLAYLCNGLLYSPERATGVETAFKPDEMLQANRSVTAQVDDPDPAIADAFKLHSRPGSTRVIYLDFNGSVSTKTSCKVGWESW